MLRVFKQFIAELGSTKRILLLTFLCLAVEAVVFFLFLYVSVFLFHADANTSATRAESFSNFIYLTVPLLIFASAFVSSFAVFISAAPASYPLRRAISAALVVGIIQTVPLFITTPAAFLFYWFGWHFTLVASPIYIPILVSPMAGNAILWIGKNEASD